MFNDVKQNKNVGIIISNNLKVSVQCTAARKKVNMMLGIISRKFYHKSQEVMKRLYTVFVRSHLE